ncbi:MAG: hypothetical protein SGJ04_00940 [Bacteroidota bacterium]|nr:hypothetical protein [Bacteroidota bacterium]
MLKNVRNYLMLLALGTAAIVSSCNKDETTVNKPTVTVNADKTSLSVNSTAVITISATAPSGGKLKKVKIEEGTTASSINTTLKDSNIDGSPANIGYTYNYTPKMTGVMRVVVTVTDDANQSTSKEISFTVTGSTSVIDCGDKSIGNQNSSTSGSFFNTSACAVVSVGPATIAANTIDFVHYFGSSNKATLASPSDQTVNQFMPFQNFYKQANKKSTTFKKNGNASFNFSTTSPTEIETGYKSSTAAAAGIAGDLMVGDVVFFLTSDNKYGVAKVTSITGTTTTDGAIGLSVKVQK